MTSPGFSPFEIGEFSIQAGRRVTREIILQVAGVFEEVNVPPTTDDDRLMNSFTRQLTSDQIEALPEDPEELARVLAPEGLAVIRVSARADGCRSELKFRTSASVTTWEPPRAAADHESRSVLGLVEIAGGTTPA